MPFVPTASLVQRDPASRLNRGAGAAYTAPMFGGMGGMGGRSPGLRYIRLGLLVALLVGTAVFHLHGSAYNTLHYAYIVIIIGVIAFTFTMNRRGGSRRGGPPGGGGGFGSPPPPPNYPPPSHFPQNSDPEAHE